MLKYHKNTIYHLINPQERICYQLIIVFGELFLEQSRKLEHHIVSSLSFIKELYQNIPNILA